jgi:SAM-dependent methyltransferase
MKQHEFAKQQIDDAAVKRYFGSSRGGTAATVSMMAHEHNLPASAARYRLNKEMRTINDWLNAVHKSGRVLAVGCGAGTWTELFARRYKTVMGIEQSSLMLKVASDRVARLPNVKILEGDGRHDLPEGSFDMIFLGGLCMYLNDSDVITLLRSLKNRLVEGGVIILRESTVHQGVSLSEGEYQAVYRSVNLYRQLFDYAGSFRVEMRRNYGYTNLVTAEELVNLRRRWLPFLPRDSSTHTHTPLAS